MYSFSILLWPDSNIGLRLNDEGHCEKKKVMLY